MSDQPANITLKLALDQAALNQGATGVDKLRKDLTDLKSTAQDAGQLGDKAASSIGNAMTGVSSEAADATKEVQKLNSALESTSQTAAKVKTGGFGVEGLRRTGGALTQLGLGDIGAPIQRIGDIGQVQKELGALTDTITKMTGATEPLVAGLSAGTVALGALAAAGAIFAGGLALIHSAYENNTKIIQQSLAQLDAYYAAIQGGTTETLQKQLKAAEDHKKAVDDELSTTSNATQRAFDAASSQYGDLGARILTALGSTGLYGDTLKDVSAKTTDLTKQSTDWQGKIDALKEAMKSAEVATNDAADAQNKYVSSLEASAAHRQELAQLENNGTSKQVQDKIDANKAQITSDSELYASLSAIANPTAETTAEIKRLRGEIDQLTSDNKQLSGSIYEAAKAREVEAQKIKDTTKALQEQAKAGDDYEKAVTAEQDARQKNADNILKIEDNANQDRADLEQSYADKRVDIARKAVDDAQDALTKLNETYQDAFESADRDLQKASRENKAKLAEDQIKFNQQEVADKTDHLQKLQDIQRNAQQADQDALLNRNFRQLFQNKQATSNAIDAENERFQRQEQQRIVALKNEESDQARAYAQQRQERLIAYGYALDDADKQYQRTLEQQHVKEQRELQDAQIANQRSLNALTTKQNRELAILQQSYAAQIKLLEQTEAQKLQILQNAQSATLAAAGNTQGTVGAGGSIRPVQMAGGGRLGAFQAAIVNEPGSSGRESFNGAQFPRSMGLFIPSQAGNVNPGGAGGNGGPTIGSVSVVIHESNNPRETEAAVYRALRKVVA